jgi:competence protein ComEC
VLHAWVGDGDENVNSIVLRVRFDDVALLLGGDCPSSCEETLRPGVIDVYKVHHHGSYDASSNTLLDRITPTWGAISAGAGNSYGHPHEETLTRLERHDTTVLRTDLDGNLTFLSDGRAVEVETER